MMMITTPPRQKRRRRRRRVLVDATATGSTNKSASTDNPYLQWEALERSALLDGMYESSDSSDVIRILLDNNNNNNNNSDTSSSSSPPPSLRLGRILTFLSSTLYSGDDEVTTTEMAALMAVHDFNLRKNPYFDDVAATSASAVSGQAAPPGEGGGMGAVPGATATTTNNNKKNNSSSYRYDDDAAVIDDGSTVDDDTKGATVSSSCNFYLTLGITRPIGNNVQDWARQYQDRVLFHGMPRSTDNANGAVTTNGVLVNVTTLRPMAILGGTTREAAVLLAQLGSVTSPRGVSSVSALTDPDVADEGVLIMSPVASTTALDDIPMFMRTVTTTRPFARTLCRYLRSIGVQYLGVFYSNDVLGASYLLDFKAASSLHDINIVPISYDATFGLASLDDDDEWPETVSKLEKSEILYYFGVLAADSWTQVIARLHQSRLLGTSDRVWFFDRTLLAGLSGLTFRSSNATDSMLVKALNRSAIVDMSAESERNVQVHAASFHQTLQDPDFVEHWNVLRQRGGPDRPASLQNFVPQPSIYSMLAYDAVMAMGLGACQTPDDDLLTGGELMNQTTHTRFAGATGDIKFNAHGTREPLGLVFRVSNIFFYPVNDTPSSSGRVEWEAVGVPCFQFNVYTNESTVLQNLTFPSGSTTPPPVTDPSDENMNQVPVGVSVVNFVLAGAVILLSLFFGAWATRRRNSPQVRASQPVFLVMVCFGALMVGISIAISASQNLSANSTCMAYAWLFALGVSLMFASLFAKTWRIHRVFKSATRFRRVEIRAKDVLWPILVVCGLEVAVLTAWTVVAPLVYTRYPVEWDGFGNVKQSNAACMAAQISSPTQYAFFGVTIAISVFTLLGSAYQSFRARNLPSQFNESKYIAISNLILVESLVIGCPVLVIARDDPATFSLALNALVAVMSLAVLLPVFVPKFTSANDLKNRRYVPTASYASDSSAGQAVSSIVHALSRRIGGVRASSGERISAGRVASSNVSKASNASRTSGDDARELVPVQESQVEHTPASY